MTSRTSATWRAPINCSASADRRRGSTTSARDRPIASAICSSNCSPGRASRSPSSTTRRACDRAISPSSSAARHARRVSWLAADDTDRRHADRSSRVLARSRRRRASVMAAREHDERARKLVHIAFGFCALTLRYLSWPQAALLAAAALVFNVFVLQRVAGHLFRPRDQSQGGRCRHHSLSSCRSGAGPRVSRTARHRRRGVGDSGIRRRHGDDRRTRTRAPADTVEPTEVLERNIGVHPVRRRERGLCCLVVPAEYRDTVSMVVHRACAGNRSNRSGGGRDHTHQARRQRVGPGSGGAGVVGDVARRCRSVAPGARRCTTRHSSRRCRERRRRVDRLSRPHGDGCWRHLRGVDRNRDRH